MGGVRSPIKRISPMVTYEACPNEDEHGFLRRHQHSKNDPKYLLLTNKNVFQMYV